MEDPVTGVKEIIRSLAHCEEHKADEVCGARLLRLNDDDAGPLFPEIAHARDELTAVLRESSLPSEARDRIRRVTLGLNGLLKDTKWEAT